MQLNWGIFHQTAFIPLRSTPNVSPLHYKLIQLYPRIRLFLSSFLEVDQIYIKNSNDLHRAISETKQNVLLAKNS